MFLPNNTTKLADPKATYRLTHVLWTFRLKDQRANFKKEKHFLYGEKIKVFGLSKKVFEKVRT